MNPDRARWNDKYRKGGHDLPSIPLLMYQGRLTRGRALDVAGGLGESAAVLALAGWTVTLADLSDVAVERARKRSRELKADVRVVQADALRLPFKGPFETIVVARFLERSIAPELLRVLAPGGTLFCENSMEGISERYCVKRGEYASLFPGLETVLDTVDGDLAVYIGRKKA
ncbi:MAG: class I SAM-dependent methyltransferase [Planctomycetaceae bacterium]|nr:class I SAM-dependent methyltransferase [Planctomycetaceae bacterium]